jgi:hypothetical protein
MRGYLWKKTDGSVEHAHFRGGQVVRVAFKAGDPAPKIPWEKGVARQTTNDLKPGLWRTKVVPGRGWSFSYWTLGSYVKDVAKEITTNEARAVMRSGRAVTGSPGIKGFQAAANASSQAMRDKVTEAGNMARWLKEVTREGTA